MSREALTRWERALERWQNALVSKALHHEPVELLDALRRTCDEHAVVCSENRVIVPNAYEVELDEPVYEELMRHRGGTLGEALAEDLTRHGERNGYEWAGPLAVRVTSAMRPPDEPYRVAGSPMPHIRADAFGAAD
ncbi:FhaA domain-containing protein [Streptomyces sp. NPDC019396]|uniref:FhaA domain-containing protein n=1 Tax=Streptomyces sp. NPDC019396 TaxID=3154687 RepID=UPI0033C6A3E4